MLVPVLLFLLGFALLIKGGDWFVDGAERIARRFQIPELLIGATVVSIGTTLPEVLVSATSALEGHGELAYGNAVGSIICNTSLIAALTVAIRPAGIQRKSLILPVAFYFAAAGFYAAVAYGMGEFTRPSGLVLLGTFVFYMVIVIRQGIQEAEHQASARVTEWSESKKKIKKAVKEVPAPLWKDLLLLVVGAVLVAVGANLLVENGTLIAQRLGVPESVIGLTFVALGTSLPELVTAITSLAKGHGALSLGNVIGANLFNLVLVGGLSITLNPFALPAEKHLFGRNASLVLDLPLIFITMGILTIPALLKGKLSRWQGILLLAIYGCFSVIQFI